MPTAANTQDIGSETMPWKWVYAQYLYGDGSHIININAENIDQGVLSTARIPNLSWNKITSDKPDYVTRWPKWNEIAQSGAESINEGNSDLTDQTEILTSYASNNGFNDTNAKGVVYKRDAIHIYNYIKGKLDSIYATQTTVNDLLSAANAMIFKGTLGTGGTITALPATHNAGWTYRVITAGTYAGKYCEVGTLIICIKDGTAAADADWTSVETNEDGSVIGPSSATDNAIAVFNGNTGRIIKNGQYVTYLNHTAANAGTSQIGCIDGLMITGTAYGNAEDLVSNKAGQLSYGDAGPQIRFSSSGQLGAVIFDHYDSTSGMGASFNFVSNQGDAAIKAGGIIAQTRAMIGGNSVNSSYVLYSNGATYINGATTINSTLTTTGTINLTPFSGEGGEIHLNASKANTTQAGIILDQLNSQLRIFGIASVDGTTKTGTGTPLVIDPYAKTITGGYTLTGALTGHASSDLALTGGEMTGNIRRFYNTSSNEALLTVLSNNQDVKLWEMGHGTASGTTIGTSNGYKLLYKGANSSTNNYLQLIARTGNGDDIVAMQVDELGKVSFTNSIIANLTGTATTATNLASKPSLAVSDTTKITVTAGGKTSDAFTVPYATTAATARYLAQDNRLEYGWGGLNCFNINAANESKAKVNDTPYATATWTHILRFNHANSAGYYTDLAVPFNANSLYYKRVTANTLNNSTTNGGWVQILDVLNYTTTLDSVYLKLSGGTLTGAINTANKTWNKIGDDAQIGDINKAGHLGIKGINGNTGIFFTTYGQTVDTAGGAITWDGTKFSISSTTPINATVAYAASLTSSAAPTITKTGTSTIDLIASTTYTLTVGGQSVIFKTPADSDTKVTNTLATTTKYYITGTTSSTTNTGTQSFDTGVYVTTIAGEISAVRHSYNISGTEKAYTYYNDDDQSIDFVFV